MAVNELSPLQKKRARWPQKYCHFKEIISMEMLQDIIYWTEEEGKQVKEDNVYFNCRLTLLNKSYKVFEFVYDKFNLNSV